MGKEFIMSLRNFSYSYDSSRLLIKIGEFHLEKGQQMAIRGASGSGKSTFLNLCAGILPCNSGEIVVAGESIRELSESQRDLFRANHIGFIHQQFHLLSNYTALENLLIPMALGGSYDIKSAKSLLANLGIDQHADRKPSHMSIGERQRLATARALVNHPDIILADEPTASLDENNSNNSIDLIKRLCFEKEIALLLVTHSTDIWQSFENKVEWTHINKR